MQSLVLLGNKKNKNKFLKEYIDNKRIKNSNIILFDQKIKISDVRLLKKVLSLKERFGEKRLIVLSDNITHEAQNTLLKILEELPENTDVIITCEKTDGLLPTVLSRSFIVNLQQPELESHEFPDFYYLINKLIDPKEQEKIYFAMLLAEKISLSQNDKEIENFIHFLRKLLIENTSNKNKDKFLQNTIFSILFSICQIYPYIANNNINKKIAFEKLLLFS